MKKKISILFLICIFSSLLISCGKIDTDKISKEKLANSKVTYFMKVDYISYLSDSKSHITDTYVQGSILKGNVNVGDTLKIITPNKEYTGKVAVIRINDGNQNLQTAKTGDLVQMVIDDYTGGNKALFLYK